MISHIKGKVILRKDDYIILESGGLGFKVFVNFEIKEDCEDEISIFTYLNVREDALTLFGFSSHEELELFETLISVSGIGPRSGMGLLALSNPITIKRAIVNEDPSILTKVSGIGKKTAERVILELRNKFSSDDLQSCSDEAVSSATEHSDAIEALIGLGYGRNEVIKALSEIPKDESLGDRIRLALKSLGKK